MPWIQNVSLADVKKGHHIRVGENAMLIQIVDPDMEHPVPLHPFKEVHQFKFLDHVEVEKVMKVFAELIVQECVQTLINNMPERYTNEATEEDWDKGYNRAMKDCVHHIQERFGVEE